MTKWTKIADEKPLEGRPVLLYMPEAQLEGNYPYTIGYRETIILSEEESKSYYRYCDPLLNDLEGQLMYQPSHWANFELLKGPYNTL